MMNYSEQHLQETAQIVSQLDPALCEQAVDLLAAVRGRGGRLLILLRHNHDPQRFHATTALSEVSGVNGRHRHGRLLLLWALQHEVRPSTVQGILLLPPIDSLVDDQHQRHAIAAHVMPLLTATRQPVSNIAWIAPQPSYSVGQASRRVQRDDSKAPSSCLCRPLAHAMPP